MSVSHWILEKLKQHLRIITRAGLSDERRAFFSLNLQGCTTDFADLPVAFGCHSSCKANDPGKCPGNRS